MLDRLPAWLRHVVIALGSSLLTVAVPLLAAHQEDVRDFLVRTLHLPIIAAPIIGVLLASLILRVTPLTRQYGVGATTPPQTPVIADSGTDVADGGSPSMAGYTVIDVLLIVLLVVFIVWLITKLL